MEINWLWTFTTPSSIGTGIAATWLTDHLIAMRDGKPWLGGDAVKGAIRMSGERLVRWLCPETPAEEEDRSVSQHPALQRLFTWNPGTTGGADYRYLPAIPQSPAAVTPLIRFSTAVEPGRSTAKDKTLRSRQLAPRQYSFSMRIVGLGGDWTASDSPDSLDLRLLVAALLACDAVGGGRSGGLGEVTVSNLTVTGAASIPWAECSEQDITIMRHHLLAGFAPRSPHA